MDDEIVLMSLGDAYFLMEDYSNAASYYKKITEIDPSNKIAHIELGSAYYWMAEYEMAVSLFQKAMNIDQNCEKNALLPCPCLFQIGKFG